MQLPGGFSPLNALKQVGDTINPLNGKTDYDVFSNVSVAGGDRSPTTGVLGAQTNMTNAMYYDPKTGQVQQNDGTSWNNISSGVNTNQDNTGGRVGTPSTTAYYGAGGTARNAKGYTADEQAQVDYYRTSARGKMGQLDTSYGNTVKGIDQTYGIKGNELNTARTNANKVFGDTTIANQGQYTTNYNQVAQNGAQQLRGLLSYLASMGGSGGTNGQVVRNLVGQGVSQELAGAGQNYGQNEVQNQTTYDTFGAEETNNRKNLNDWYNESKTTAQGQYDQTKQTLLGLLGSLDKGGAPVADLASALGGVDVPNTTFSTKSYDGTTPTYTAPTLSKYTAKLPTEANINTPQNNGTPMSYLNTLAKQRKDNVIA
jgi:hypothetical protein